MNKQWLDYLKLDRICLDDYLHFLNNRREEVRSQYKNANHDKVLQLQGMEKALDMLSEICRIDDREKIALAAHEQAQRGHDGT